MKMKAGIVSVKIPIKRIFGRECTEDVTCLQQSIAVYGLLQPIGVVREKEGYRLVFGARRLQACRNLGHTCIHAVLLTVRPEEEDFYAFQENCQHREAGLAPAAKALLALPEGVSEAVLCLEQQEIEDICMFLRLPEAQKEKVTPYTKMILRASRGDGAEFERCFRRVTEQLFPKKVHITGWGDKRIYLNEVTRIAGQMRKNGFCDHVEEDENRIVFYKNEVCVTS